MQSCLSLCLSVCLCVSASTWLSCRCSKQVSNCVQFYAMADRTYFFSSVCLSVCFCLSVCLSVCLCVDIHAGWFPQSSRRKAHHPATWQYLSPDQLSWFRHGRGPTSCNVWLEPGNPQHDCLTHGSEQVSNDCLADGSKQVSNCMPFYAVADCTYFLWSVFS